MPLLAAGFVFTHHDRRRLTAALRRVRDVRYYRRLQAVLLVAEGHSVGATASLLKGSRRWVTKALARYRARRCPQDLAEGKHSGRPPRAPGLSVERLTALLHTDPMSLGYAAVGWTAPLLAAQLRRCGEVETLSARSIRERLHAAGLAWKRPRYVFSQKEPHRAQKKGLSRAG
ncbi:MAG: helix-turn-helix domain-containing protein [Verrucomicrobia bacterium]|nr:helix-turn-helix domain-containing protein [Verrucomicrobiota bacterium]